MKSFWFRLLAIAMLAISLSSCGLPGAAVRSVNRYGSAALGTSNN